MGYVETATIELDRPREFRVSFMTLRRFQKATGKPFQVLGEMMTALQAGDREVDEGELIELLGTLVWAGCVSDDSSLTIEIVLDNLAMDPTEQLRPAFEAMARAMPSIEGNSPLANGTGPNPLVRKDGGRSGRSRGRS